jgi:thiamine pyrophosphate-dependent acetolactate synthase large subunit-like protein
VSALRQPAAGLSDGCAAVAEIFAQAGIETVYTLAGSDVGGVAKAAADRGLKVVGCRDERSAAFMAASHGALMRSPGICLVTQGPGLTNAITGLVQAQQGGWPVVSIAGIFPREAVALNPLQELDQAGLMRPVSIFAEVVPTGDRLPDLLWRALRAALGPPRGHAHLSIPGRVLSDPAPELKTWPGGLLRPPAADPDPARLAEAAAHIRKARRPVLLIGPGAWFADAAAALSDLLERLPIPTFTFDEARGIISDSHPASLGSLLFRLNGAASLIAEADVVITVGLRPDWRVEHLAPPFFTDGTVLVQIDSNASELMQVGATVPIFGDEARAIAGLMSAAGQDPPAVWNDWTARLHAARTSWLAALEGADGDAESGITPLELILAVRTAAEKHDANVVIDGGHIGKWAKALLTARRPGALCRLKGGFAAIGHGLPSAIVRSLTDRDRATLLITGDGAFGYGFLDLETAVAEDLPIVAVVAVDEAWGSVRTSQIAAYGRAVATDLPATRFDQLAEALGAGGAWIDRAADLDAALETALTSRGPTVLAVSTRTVPSPAVYPRGASYERHKR